MENVTPALVAKIRESQAQGLYHIVRSDIGDGSRYEMREYQRGFGTTPAVVRDMAQQKLETDGFRVAWRVDPYSASCQPSDKDRWTIVVSW